jgi:hypothetical protein
VERDVSILRPIERALAKVANPLRLRSGTVLAKNTNGSYQVAIDGATHYQVYSQSGLDYAPGVAAGAAVTNSIIVRVAVDGFGRATIIP